MTKLYKHIKDYNMQSRITNSICLWIDGVSSHTYFGFGYYRAILFRDICLYGNENYNKFFRISIRDSLYYTNGKKL